MPIARTRAELVGMVRSSYTKLREELDRAGPGAGRLPCVDDWSMQDLLAVRLWWTRAVVRWIEAGRRGKRPVTPKQGYRWRETPRLNADIVRASGKTSYRALRSALERGYARVLETIDSLDDRELLSPGVFPWAGRYPLARWISINTARQYVTARAFLRRALRNGEGARRGREARPAVLRARRGARRE